MSAARDEMAGILLDHRFSSKGSCICGVVRRELDPQWIARHLADALAEAGYGKLADAWDAGQKSGMRHADRVIAADRIGRPELPGPPSPNPYRSMGNCDDPA